MWMLSELFVTKRCYLTAIGELFQKKKAIGEWGVLETTPCVSEKVMLEFFGDTKIQYLMTHWGVLATDTMLKRGEREGGILPFII